MKYKSNLSSQHFHISSSILPVIENISSKASKASSSLQRMHFESKGWK